MQHSRVSCPAYVIKAYELRALKFIAPDYPRPQGLEWIDRGRDVRLRPTTIEMLVRTLYRGKGSLSVQRLHHSAGLRVLFRSDADRQSFAARFRKALACMASAEQDAGEAV